jgi:hypothetical protein
MFLHILGLISKIYFFLKKHKKDYEEEAQPTTSVVAQAPRSGDQRRQAEPMISTTLKNELTGALLLAIKNNKLHEIKEILELGADCNHPRIIRALAENTHTTTLGVVVFYSKQKLNTHNVLKLAYILNNREIISYICTFINDPNVITNEIITYLIDNVEFNTVRNLVERGLNIFRPKLSLTWQIDAAERKLNTRYGMGTHNDESYHRKSVELRALKNLVLGKIMAYAQLSWWKRFSYNSWP